MNIYEADKVILEVDKNGNQTARNVYGTNLLMRTADGDTYFYLYNGHADVTALIAEDGTAAVTYYYDAFGNILEKNGKVNNNILYSGYQYDEETGLYYLNTRMYDSKTARFIQEDTYAGDPNDPLSLNLYTYCHNNPIVYWDPTGHFDALDPDDWAELIEDAEDAVVSYTGCLIGETFNHLVYKPAYTLGKGIGGAETFLFGTKYFDNAAESYQNDVDVTMDFFYSWGSNETAKNLGATGGVVIGSAMESILFWEAGAASGLTAGLTPLESNMALNYTTGSITSYINGYADGYRGNDLLIASLETGTMCAATGYAIETVPSKLSNGWGIFKDIFKPKGSIADELASKSSTHITTNKISFEYTDINGKTYYVNTQGAAEAETYYFRGTTEGYAGNPSLQRIGITPTSTDHLVSTVFATEAEAYGNGVLHIASGADLKGVNILEGNVLANLEKEVGIDLAPSEFAQKSSINISAKDARGILKEMGYNLPESIYSKEQLNSVLKNSPRLSQEEIQTFIQKATNK
jgi:RHS repeat-associated protein